MNCCIPLRYRWTAFFAGMTFILSAFSAYGNDSPILLNSDSRHLSVGKGIYYFIENQPLTHLQIADKSSSYEWKKAKSTAINLGSGQNPTWFMLRVQNKTNRNIPWVMEIGWPLLDRIDVFQHNEKTGEWHPDQAGGNLVPVEINSIEDRNFLFPLNLPHGEIITIYIRIVSKSNLIATFDLWQGSAFWQSNRHHHILLGLFFGILIAMLCYNLSLYFFIKDQSYFYYSFYVFSIILFTLSYTGTGRAYIWDTTYWIKQNAYYVFGPLGFLTGTLFVRQFLSLKQYGGWILKLNNVFLAYWSFATFSYAFWLNQAVEVSIEPMALLSCVAGFITGIYLWSKGNISAKYYTIAWTFLNIGTFIYSLSISCRIPYAPVSQYIQMSGFALEVILLSFALGERINRETKRREEAQQVALEYSQKMGKEREEKLYAQEQVLELQQRTTEELEQRVLDRTGELERAMNNLEIANRELSRLNITDPLTKVYNRRYFDEVLSKEIKHASRAQQPVSLAIVDIDHFKNINDSFGHLIGDECLRQVAKTLNETVGRTSDFVGRYGGEEFAIILPSTSPENALIVAERIRLAIEKFIIIQRGERVEIRVSVGVAGWIPRKNEAPEQLITAADKALYQAKNTGRNKILSAGARS